MERNGIISVTLLYAAKRTLHCHRSHLRKMMKWKAKHVEGEWRGERGDAPLHVHVCKNVLQCSCDEPFCCASSRCSPPQRRALPRRVAPFSDTREADLLFFFLSHSLSLFLLLVSDTLSSVFRQFFFFPLLLLWCETQEPPSSSYSDCVSSLAFPLGETRSAGELKLQQENTSCK